jgi:hypothetical protein
MKNPFAGRKCSTPGCNCTGPLYMHGKCHPSSPTWAILHQDVVTIVCAECDNVVVYFKVAKEDA